MAQDHMLQEALDAARQGQRERARDLLTRLLRTNQANVEYWLGMSSVVDSPKEQIYCLEKALEIDPNNDAANRGLILLGGRSPDENILVVKPDRKREWDLGKIGSKSGKDGKKKLPVPLARLATLGGVVVIAFALIYFGIFNPLGDSPGRSSASGGITRTPLGSNKPTSTTIGDVAPIVDGPLPTFVGPTPLSMLLDQPYTPTPRYVNTLHPSTGAYRSAMIAFDRDNWEDGIKFLDQAIELEPGAADLRYHLGIALLNLGEYFDAKGAFLDATNIDPDFGAAYFGMALADISVGLEGELVDELNSALTNDSELGEAYVQRAIFRLSRANTDGALADLDRAELRSPNSALLYLTFANTFLSLESYDEALSAAQRSYDIDITIVETYWIMAQAYHALGQSRNVISPIQTYLLYEEENAQAWFVLGQALVAEGYYENGIVALEEALALEDTLGEVNYYRGLAYLELEDYDNALKYLLNSSDNFPRWFEPNVTYGRLLLETGNPGEAYKKINQSSAFAKTPEQLAVLYYWRALALESLADREEEALLDWESLMRLSTDVVPNPWEALARSRLSDAGIPIPSRTPPAPTSTPSPTPTPSVTPTPSATPP